MSDHVSWGLYIANFTFIVGELLAIAAIIMCLLFVTVDLGRLDRFWHLIPGIGRFNFPISMLTWDVIVLNGYPRFFINNWGRAPAVVALLS